MSKLLDDLEHFEALLLAIPDARHRLVPLFEYLVASEAKVVATLKAAKEGRVSPLSAANAAAQTTGTAPYELHTPTATATTPTSPRLQATSVSDTTLADSEVHLEFGMALYWLHHPTLEHAGLLQTNRTHALVLRALQHLAPPSRMDYDLAAELGGNPYNIGYVAADGTLFTLGKYAMLDPHWILPIINYAINLLDPASLYAPFPTTPYTATIDANIPAIRIAMLGDWGTGVYDANYAGKGPAAAVMQAIKGLQPDYVVHLGDVYYSGTANRHPEHEEQDNFLNMWDTGTAAQTSFALNSNHEKYGAEKGLIGIALNNGTPFSHQRGTTYFGLQYGKWVILGLDSAYFDPSTLYLQGALGDTGNTQQQAFIQSTFGNLAGRKVLTMTHHSPMSFDGNSITPNSKAGTTLWDGMHSTLGGRAPDVWYWGHIHLGAAYNPNSAIGKLGTLGRCVGHSAIPFGRASGMNTGNVDYYAHTELAPGSKQMRNGFAILTLRPDGSMSEVFYEVSAGGQCTPYPIPQY